MYMSVHTGTHAHAVSPHTLHPATPSLQLEELGGPPGPFPAVKDLSSAPPPRAEGWPGRVPTPSPAWVTAGTLPASFLPGEARAAPRLMQPCRNRGWQGCVGARAGWAALAAATGTGASTLHPRRGPTRHHASIHHIHTASLLRFAPALPYLHEQPPPAPLPFSDPRHGRVPADIPRVVGTSEDPPLPAVAPREVKRPPRRDVPAHPRAARSLHQRLHICFVSVPEGRGDS